jgi:hypothetical protein
MIFEGKWTDLTGDAIRYRLDADPWEKAAALIATRPELSLSPERMVTVVQGHDIADLVTALVQAGIKVRAVEPLKQSLEEIYLNLVGSPSAAGPS